MLDTAKVFWYISRIKINQILIVVNQHPKVVFVGFEIGTKAKSRLIIDILLFLLVFRAICLNYETVMLIVNCHRYRAPRPEC